MHDFDLREFRLLNLILELSFEARRTIAYVPRLELFVKAEGISRGNVSAILRRLKACNVIQEEPQWYYGLLLLDSEDPTANWRVPVRHSRIEVIRQLDLLERPPNINDALREGFVDTSCSVISRLGSVPGFHARIEVANDPRFSDSCHGVPDSGTGQKEYPNWERQFHAITERVSSCVPDSGTPHGSCNMVHDRNSMNHAIKAIGETSFDVGALEKQTGNQILDLLLRQAGHLNQEHREQWLKRISECPKLVWDLAQEARVSSGIRNKAGWLNRAYMREMGVGKYATK
ncbi:MAG: hypothetical protein NT154_05365 [Verrucomicrobia bacterium]|nr:hypothetical protein [Verrucomicrobiota bacterium]